MNFRILQLTPDFNYSDGRSYYVYLLLKYLNRSGHKAALCTNGGNSFDRLNDEGIQVYTFPNLLKKSYFPESVKFISGIIEQEKIDIIHSHHRYLELLSLTAARGKNVHTVFTALSIVDRRYFVEYKSEKIIAVSNAVRDMLIKRFSVNKKRISLIPNFTDSEEIKENVNPESTKYKKLKKLPAGQTAILSIGRFHKEKNYETLLNAVSLLKKYDIKLIFVGEGSEKSGYDKIISRSELNAEFFPPQRNLKEFFEISDICILTSVRDPFPGFMLQSGLHRKAFIGADTDGISEMIRNGKNGLLFKKRNEHELAEKIKLFMENDLLAAECADNLYREVLDKYTEKSVIPEIEDLYTGLFL